MPTDTVTSEPIVGFICPACGHGESIQKVTRTRPLGPGDFISAWWFGFIGVILASYGRSTVRLKCGNCGCQFPRPAGSMARFGYWLLWMAVLASVAFGFTVWSESGVDGPASYPILVETTAAFHSLAERPRLAIILLLVPILALLIVLIEGNLARHRERMRAWRAVCKGTNKQPSPTELAGRQSDARTTIPKAAS